MAGILRIDWKAFLLATILGSIPGTIAFVAFGASIDITYLPTAEGWLYLAGVIDLYSRKFVGWAMGETMTSDLVCQALQMAIKTRKPEPGLLHHSDRGSHYAIHAYQALLKQLNFEGSMSRSVNCYDHAVMESAWGTLKSELDDDDDGKLLWPTRQRAKSDVFLYIEAFYNRRRYHSALGYLSTDDFERLNATMA